MLELSAENRVTLSAVRRWTEEPARDAIASLWRDRLVEIVAETPDAPLLLSGGTDSLAILAALLSIGSRPTCFTAVLAPGPTSTDLRVAELVCGTFGLAHHRVSILRQNLERDVRYLIGRLQTDRKSAIQCAHFLHYLGAKLAAEGFREAFIGTGGVSEDNRKVNVLNGTGDQDAVTAYRRSTIYGSTFYVLNGTKAMHEALRWHDVEAREPYADPRLAEYALSLSFAELNSPVQKGIAVRAFPGFWRAGAFYRHNSPLQIASGVRELHDTLLASPLNRRGSKAVRAVYADILAEERDGAPDTRDRLG